MKRPASIGLTLVILLFFWGELSGCAGSPPASLTPPLVLHPTWTPTPAARVRPRIMPGPARPRPSSRPTQPAPILTPGPAAARPTPAATVSPLPAGAGRSPVRIRIPALGLDAPVQPMTWQNQGDRSIWQVPENAAGHHIDSAFPGEVGNVVISGHHNMGQRVFARLSSIGEANNPLRPGDAIILQDEVGRRITYRITRWQRIPEKNAPLAIRHENASYLLPTDFPQLTLITCWPATNNTHRVIIQARLTQILSP